MANDTKPSDFKWLPVLDDPPLGLLVNPIDQNETYLAWPYGGAWGALFINSHSRDFLLSNGKVYTAVPYSAAIHEKIIRLRDALTNVPYRHPYLTQLVLEMP